MAISGHVTRQMLKHYSHIRTEAKHAALDAIATQPSQRILDAAVDENVHQLQSRDSKAPAN
jgi:hypothetical protein